MENNLELFFVGGVGEDFRVGVSQNESQGFFFGRGSQKIGGRNRGKIFIGGHLKFYRTV